MVRPSFFSRRETRELIILMIFMTVALLLRFIILDARTIHIDEGMGLRASALFWEGLWQYSPANGHGPTLFILGALLKATTGLTIITARAAMVIVTMLAIGMLAAYLRSRVSFPALIVLLLSLGLSSGMTFFSAYFIHEMLFILFTVMAYCAMDAWWEKKRGALLIAALSSCVLMYATKETAILTWAAWIIATCVLLFDEPDLWKHVRTFPWRIFFLGLLLAGCLWIILFSGGFRSPEGVKDALQALMKWSERASVMHHRPFWYFGALLLAHEFPLVLGASALAAGLFHQDLWNRKLTWVAVWWVSIFFIYSIIPYKTPWCIPNIILPLGIFMTFGFDVLWRRNPRAHHILAFVTALLVGMQCVITWNDTFVHPDEEGTLTYAYLQSNQNLTKMTNILHDLSLLRGGSAMPMQIIGNADELLYVLTEPYNRSFEPFQAGLPVYINYQHSFEEARNLLAASGTAYVRLIFTYIQNVNSIDVFVEQSLWHAYMALHPDDEVYRAEDGDYDFR